MNYRPTSAAFAAGRLGLAAVLCTGLLAAQNAAKKEEKKPGEPETTALEPL